MEGSSGFERSVSRFERSVSRFERSSSRGGTPPPPENADQPTTAPTSTIRSELEQLYPAPAVPITPSFVSFIYLSIFTLSNHFGLNHFFRYCVDPELNIPLGSGSSFHVFIINRSGTPGAPNTGLPGRQLLAAKMPILGLGNRGSRVEDEVKKRQEKRFRDIILELRVLIHAPLRMSENIVNLEGVCWQHSVEDPEVVVPVLLLEFAEFGTLKDLLKREGNSTPATNNAGGEGSFGFETKISLIFDVAMGLDSLHNCDIVHGDIKPANVLIFPHPQRRYIAKLADFGYCSVESPEVVCASSGTWPWTAPEWKEEMPRALVKKTDLYPFGLVMWQVLLGGGVDVFDYLREAEQGPNEEEDVIESLKHEDRVVEKAREWTVEQACGWDEDRVFFIMELFEATLPKDPEERSLARVLEILSGAEDGDQLADSMAELGLGGRHQRSVGIQIADLDPAIQRTIILDLENVISGLPASTSLNRQDALGALAAIHLANPHALAIDGADIKKGLNYLRQSAVAGSWGAQVMFYRAYRAFGEEIPRGLPVVDWMKLSIFSGLHNPIDDLAEFDPREYQQVMAVRRHYCPPETVEMVKTNMFLQDYWGLGIPLHTMVIAANHYHDDVHIPMIHIAATCGFPDVVEFLIGSTLEDPNNAQTNGRDTPLICACRQGHYSVVVALLNNGADASHRNAIGENALHFLGWFSPDKIDHVATLLVGAGAGLESHATRNNLPLQHEWDSTHCPGTPLYRAVARNKVSAVRALLRLGANPLAQSIERSLKLNPVQLACRYHNSDSLEVLLQESRPTIDVRFGRDSTGAPLQTIALVIAEASENMSRHGARFEEKLRETLELLLSNGADIENCDGAGTHAIVNAVTHGNRDVAAFLLEKLNGGENELSRAYGELNFTLLHLAIEFGQAKMAKFLLDRGASPLALCGPEYEKTSLHLVATSRTGPEFLDLARRFIEEGVPIDGCDPSFETPLSLAVRSNNFELATLLLDRGANPNATFTHMLRKSFDDPYTILGHLVADPHDAAVPQVAFFLCEGQKHGLGDLGVITDDVRLTALQLVARMSLARPLGEGGLELPRTCPARREYQRRNDTACIRISDLLVRHFRRHKGGSDDGGASERVALVLAVANANMGVLKVLLDAGVDPKTARFMGKSPLEHVAFFQLRKLLGELGGRSVAGVLTGEEDGILKNMVEMFRGLGYVSD
ncbi:MAG: hypothetical protein M1839_005715 [Geoglossum umbratile]|nr:MAG: hypothetical protein M1839_005715 [Geoglossum umbratile]